MRMLDQCGCLINADSDMVVPLAFDRSKLTDKAGLWKPSGPALTILSSITLDGLELNPRLKRDHAG
jgi:hypothetical protein